jgi:hypothetical protein
VRENADNAGQRERFGRVDLFDDGVRVRRVHYFRVVELIDGYSDIVNEKRFTAGYFIAVNLSFILSDFAEFLS